MPLSPDQTRAFERDGRLLVRGAFSAAEIPACSAALDALARRPPEIGRKMVYVENSVTIPPRPVLSRIEAFVDDDPTLAAVVSDPRVVDPAASLLGDRAVLFKD